MKAVDEKRHMLETLKQDYDINVGLERAADKHIKRISAELSAFFVAHQKDDHIDTSILRKLPTIHDLTQLRKLAKELSKINEINVKKRKMMYLSMGTTDMELYMQALMGLMMLPMANNAFQLMEKTLLNEFRDEYQRQSDDLGIDKPESNPITDAELQDVSEWFTSTGGLIITDDESVRMLDYFGIEASAHDGYTISLRPNTNRAAVYEELYHAKQYRDGIIVDTGESRLKAEILTQHYLLDNAKKLKLSDYEIMSTEKALKDWEADLNEFYNKNGISNRWEYDN